jgi:aspartyl-tRNA(Asn)/glutamyl-tRNA(Gln) amidotransferase subunit A
MLTDKSLVELSAMLESKETNAVEIVKDYKARIDLVNQKINAYITVDEEQLLKDAVESDKRRSEGKALSKFDGIPLAIKDNICTKGIKTTCGSGILQNFVAPYNAGAYEKLLEKGIICLGKANMDEFAMGSTNESSFFGPVKNPHNLECVPGGSSGGSAAVVAAKIAPAALGSDTGGSIRQPASFCGVVGVKPTYGRVSRYGLVAFASSLDQIGPVTRSVDDAAYLLDFICGWDKRDSTSVNKEYNCSPASVTGDVNGMKIGVPEEYFNGINPEIKDAVEEKIKELESQGAEIVKISLKMTDYAIPIYYLIATAEASSNLSRFDGVRYGHRSENIANLSELYKKSRSEGFGDEVKRRIMLGTFALSSGYYDAYYLQAMKGRTLVVNEFKEAFEKVDAIVSPVTTSTAFKLGEKISDPLEMYLSDLLTISANLAGIPGMSVPVGKDKNGLPIGMQIMSKHFDEKNMLNVGKAIEKNSETVSADI